MLTCVVRWDKSQRRGIWQSLITTNGSGNKIAIYRISIALLAYLRQSEMYLQ